MNAFRALFLLTLSAGVMIPFEPLRAQDVSGPTGTVPLTTEGDLASQMVDGIDRFLLKEIEKTAATRAERFTVDTSSREAYEASLKPHREKLAKCLGIRDARMKFDAPEIVADLNAPSRMVSAETFDVQRIRWPVLNDPSPQGQGLPSLFGEGLLVMPKTAPKATVIILAEGHLTSSGFGLVPDEYDASLLARHLADAGCRVIIQNLISRNREKRLGRADLTNREYVHRSAFELGRTLAGYEVQTTLSLVDWLKSELPEHPIGLFGYGEGGQLALFAGGLDNRIDVTCVSGFFDVRENCWQEPIDRNFFGLLRDFGASELAMLVAPRTLVVENSTGPELTLEGNGGAPSVLKSPNVQAAKELLEAAKTRTNLLCKNWLMTNPEGGNWGAFEARVAMLTRFDIPIAERSGRPRPQAIASSDGAFEKFWNEEILLKQIDRHNQALLRESHFVRKDFMSKLDMSSVEAYEKSAEPYREIFRKDVIGEFEQPLLPFNARSRKSWETDKWTGHEVVLDVFPDVFAFGVLLLPKDLKPGEKRPVVVCQHGLEGRPTDIFQGDHPAYHDFAAKLCERGFITFSPQNPYIFQDRFRTLQRKAQPLGKSLFSIIVPQHQQIVNWLKTQPNVDGDRIAFYGLSYGGKSAMRIPALVTDYCLSICSADFNEWVLKNASTRENFSYIWTGEYEIFEWDLGSTFNYAEMAALICPRPFMVERGHFDGVGEDHWVGYEYAKIRHLYAAQLKIGDKTEIEWFVGPHTINGQGTYQFLHKHLNWPEPK